MQDLVELKKEQRKPLIVLSWIFWGATFLFFMLTIFGLSLGVPTILFVICALVTECASQYMKGWIAGYQRAIRK